MPIDDTLAEGLQAMSAWLDYLEEQKARYRGQLERARRAQGKGGEQPEAKAWEAWEDTVDAAPEAAWETWEKESTPQDTWQAWASADEQSEAQNQEQGADVLLPDDELSVSSDADAWDAPPDETSPDDETGTGSAASVPVWFDASPSEAGSDRTAHAGGNETNAPDWFDAQPESTDGQPIDDDDDDDWM